MRDNENHMQQKYDYDDWWFSIDTNRDRMISEDEAIASKYGYNELFGVYNENAVVDDKILWHLAMIH